MDNIDDYLKDIYYKPEHPASFSGLSKLYNYVKRDGKLNVSKSDIHKWLRQQEAYSLHRQVRKPIRTPIIVAGIDDQWSADLMDVSRFAKNNNGIKYLLVVIDTFSKFLWIRPLKDKTGAGVARAFQDIFQNGRKPNRLRSDKGQEFRAKSVADLMKSENIRQIFAQNETKAAVSERVIKTVKSKLFRYLTYKNSFEYIDQLDKFVNSYNNTIHNTTQYRPSDVSVSNEEEVRLSTYLHRKQSLPQPKPYKYKVGDKVRITYLRNKFSREYDHKWTGEIFTVKQRFKRSGQPVYRLSDYNQEPIDGTLYQNELSLADLDDNNLFKIENIIKERGKGVNKEYFVKWLYWPKKFNSWVKANTLEQA